MPTCYFLCVNGMDESPIMPLEMEAPAVGSILFFEGEKHGYEVLRVEYQLRKRGHIGLTELPRHELALMNVIVKRIDDRTFNPKKE